MNWKKLLKDRAGLTQSAKFLLTTAGVGAVAFYTLSGAADEQVRQERALRDLSSMSASSPYSGLRQSERGLSSINIRDSRGQVATAREREAMERNSGANSDFGLSGIENLNAGSIGQAMQFSDSSEGLTMGGDKGTENAVRFASGADMPNMGARHSANYGANSGENGSGSAGDFAQSNYAGNGSNSSGAGKLGSASMAHAVGSSSASSYNPANPSGNSPVNNRNGESAYQMSGAMPDGSTMLAMGGSHNPKNSGFSSGRNLQVGRSKQNGQGKGELADITAKSVAAAQNTARSANEGARAFQSGQTSSSGLGSDTFGGIGGASSSDLSTSTKGGFKAPNTKVNMNSVKEDAAWNEEYNNAQDKLDKTFRTRILIALGLIAAFSFIFKLMQAWRGTPWGEVAYWGVALLFVAGITWLLWDVFKQARDVKEIIDRAPRDANPSKTGVIIKEVLAGLTIGGAAAMTVFPTKISDGIKWLVKRAAKTFPMQAVSSVKNVLGNEMHRR